MKKKILVLLLTITALLTACQTQFPGLSVPAGIGTPVPPALLSVRPVAEDMLLVTFSTNVLKSSAEDLSHYSVTSSNLTILSASLDHTNGALLWLTTSKMSAASNYTLQCSGVEGENGLASAADNLSFNGFGADDSTPPSIIITEPVDSQLIAKYFLVYGTASDDTGIDHVDIRVDGGTYVMATNTVNWSYQLDTTVYNEAYSHVIYAKAVDLKGNSKVATVTVNIDRTPPTLTANPPSGVKVINPGDTITITGTADDNVQFSMVGAYLTNLGSTNAYGGTWIDSSNWQIVITNTGYRDESTNRITVFAQDTAGNITTTNTEYVLYRNTVYVRTNGDPTGDGTWWHPRDTISGAQSINTSYWNRIYVAAGIYDGETFLNKGRWLFGGYNQNFIERDIPTYKTVLTNCVYYLDDYFDGFYIYTVGSTFNNNINASHSYEMSANYIFGSVLANVSYFKNNIVTVDNVTVYGRYGHDVTGNIFSNTVITISTRAIGNNIGNFSQNTIYGEVDDTTSASIAGCSLFSTYMSNTFIGFGDKTNVGFKLNPFYIGSASIILKYDITGNIFSNYQTGIFQDIYSSFGYSAYSLIHENIFYTKNFAFYENTANSDPTNFISNRFHLLGGNLYYDYDRTPNEVGTIADLNALDENGYNFSGTVYSNVTF